jgi:hypothetical protein
MRRYAALIWPTVGAVAMAVITAYVNAKNNDNLITSDEAVTIVIQGASILIVWLSANLTAWPKIKFAAMGVMAVLNGLVTFIDGGLTTLEIANLAIAFLSAAGVALAPGPVTAREITPVVQQ